MKKYEVVTSNLQVVFNNAFNKEVIKDLTSSEHNLLMGLLGRLKEKEDAEVIIDFDEVSALCGLSDRMPKQITELSNSLWDKVKMTDYSLYSQSKSGPYKTGGVMLFSYLAVDKDEQVLRLKINPDLQYFVNSFSGGSYTSLKFKDFQQTKDKYGKLLYRLLAQYSNTGFYKVKSAELKYLLDCPPSYDTRRFNEKVINPAVKNLLPFFENLKVEKIKKGRTITHYQFNFTPQTSTREWDPDLGKKSRKDVTPKPKNPSKRKSRTRDDEKTVNELSNELEQMWKEAGLER